MTPWLPSADPQWQLAGWTMLLFLGVGTAVAALGAAVRWACRRAAPNVRYAISLVTLAALAATPIAVAAYLGASGVPTIDVAIAQKPPAPPVDSVSLAAPIDEPSRQNRPPAEPVASIIELHNLSTPPADLELPLASSSIATPNVSATPGRSPGLSAATQPGATAGLPSSAGPPSPLAAIIAWLPVVWLAGAPLTFALLAAGLVGSRHFRRRGLPLDDSPVADACRRLQRALGVTRRVALAACDHVAQPVLVGIFRPTILLPAAAIAGWSPTDLEMILLHELAHVRRWDNLVNLIQRLIESLLFFHPCVWLASRQVRRDREDCCDELVVRHTNEPEAYATLLINVASSTRPTGRLHPRHTAALLAASTMAAHPLASRVRRILKIEDEPMKISRRMLVLILLLAVGASTAAYRAAFAVPAPIAADGETAHESGDDDDADAAPGERDDDEVIIRRIYKFEDSDQVNVGDWMRLIANGRRGVEVRWLDDSSGLVVSAPDSLHKQIAEFLETSRQRAGASSARVSKLNNELVQRKQELVEVAEELTEVEVLKAVALRAVHSPKALDEAVAYELARDPVLKQLLRTALELKQQVQRLQVAIQDGEAPGQVEQLRMLQADQASAEELLTSCRKKAEREARERFANAPNEALRAAIAEYNVRKEAALKKQADVEAAIVQIEAQLRDLTENDLTPQRDDSDSVLTQLAERKQELAKVAEELRELEVLREVSLQSGPGSGALDQAVAEQINNDPQIKLYQEQLFSLKMQIQQLESSTRNPQNATLRRYQAQYQEMDQALAVYRSQAEKEARERLARMPDDNLREAEAAYEARRAPLVIRQTVIEAEIAALEVAIRRRSVDSGAPPKVVEHGPASTNASDSASDPTADDAQPNDINVVLTTAYKIEDADRDTVRDWVRIVDPQPDVTSRWHADSSILVFSAPRRVQSKLTDFINSRRLLRDPNAEPLDIPRPRAELEKLQRELASVVEELQKAEKFERAARDHTSTPETIKAAVDAALARDPNLQSRADELEEAKKQLAELNASDASEEQIQEAIRSVQILTARLEAARGEVEQATRSQLGQLNYRKLADDVTEHKSTLKERQAEIEHSIADLEAQLVAIASPPAELAVTRTYPVGEVGAVEFAGWIQLICTDHPGVPIQWFDRDKSRIVIAPKRVHQQVTEFLSTKRGGQHHGNRDAVDATTDGASSADPPVQGSDSPATTPADASMTLEAAKAVLRATKTKELESWPGQDFREAELTRALQTLFHSDTHNLRVRKVYRLAEMNREDVRAFVDHFIGFSLDPYGPRLSFTWLESEDGKEIAIDAAEAGHEYFDLRFALLRLRGERGPDSDALAENEGGGESASTDTPAETSEPPAAASPPLTNNSAPAERTLQTIRIRALGDITEANAQRIVRDFLAAGQQAHVEKEGDAFVIVVETDMPHAKPVWETRAVDGVIEKVVRLVSPQAPIPGVTAPAGTPVGPTYGYDTTPPAPVHRYDGKTFETWRDSLRYELSINRRVVAARALAAFARAGRGRDAAEAILDVAVEYDFSFAAMDRQVESAEVEFKQTLLQLLTDVGQFHIAEHQWLPLLAERVADDPAKWARLANRLLERVKSDTPEVSQLLQPLTTSADDTIAKAAREAYRRREYGWPDLLESDKNKDGRIDATELEPKAWEGIRVVDSDADQAVTQDEWVAAAKRSRKNAVREEAMMQDH